MSIDHTAAIVLAFLCLSASVAVVVVVVVVAAAAAAAAAVVVVVVVVVEPQCCCWCTLVRFQCRCCCCSVWEGVPGPQVERLRPEQAVRHEGAEEGLHRAEDQDHGAHQDGETGTTATSVLCAAWLASLVGT